MSPLYFVPFLFAALATKIGCDVFRRVAPRFGLIDKPDALRKLQKRPIPVGGGAVVFLVSFAAIVPAFLLDLRIGELSRTLFVSISAAGALLVAVGLVDDRKGVSGFCKLFFQVVAASLIVAFAKDYSKIEFFGREIELGRLFYPLAVCWLVGTTNAINLLDGADGVVSTVGILIFAAIGTIGIINNYWGAATLAFVFAASLLGFFAVNRPPARLYLGDAGSLFVGFAIGVLLLRVCATRRASLQVVPAICLTLVPLADVVFAIVRRLNSGRSVFSPDRGHVHHRLQRRFGKGFPVLAALAIIQIPFCISSVAGVYWRDDLVSTLAGGAFLTGIIATGIFGRDEIKILYYRGKYRLLKRLSRQKYDRRGEVFHPQGTIRWLALWEEALADLRTSSCVSAYLDVNMPFLNEDFYSEWNDSRFGRRLLGKNRRLKTTITLTVDGRPVGRVGMKFDLETTTFAQAAAVADKVSRRCLNYIETEMKRRETAPTPRSAVKL